MRGGVAALTRHPVKGFTPEHLQRVELRPDAGFPYDRAYAVEDGLSGFDPAAPAHVSKMKFTVLAKIPALARVRTRLDDASGIFHASAPGAEELSVRLDQESERARFADWLTPVLADAVRGPLRVLPAPGAHRFYDHPQGMVSLINLASVADIAAHIGRPIDPLRFRANIYVSNWPAWCELEMRKLRAFAGRGAGARICADHALRGYPCRSSVRRVRYRHGRDAASRVRPCAMRHLSAHRARGSFGDRRCRRRAVVSATLVSLWMEIRKRLQAAGIDSPVFDARLLLEAGAGVSRLDIITDPRRPLSDAQVAAVETLVRRREAREPVAYILGRKGFWSLEFAVNSDVLIPRPDTETLVAAALNVLPPEAPARILDLGTGSGAILFALLSERPLARGLGVDVSEAALEVARANAASLMLSDRAELRRTDWALGVEGEFDLVVSNPPYIASAALDELEPEVSRFEPRRALDGGADGFDAYRAIVAALPGLLKPGAWFALEVGQDQAGAVADLAGRSGLLTDAPILDLGGVARVVTGRRP